MSNLRKVNTQEFNQDVLQSGQPVLVDFFADWCGPCNAQTPILESVADKYADTVQVVKVDIDAEVDLAREYGVRSIPTLMLFKDGAPLETRIGVSSSSQLDTLLNEYAS